MKHTKSVIKSEPQKMETFLCQAIEQNRIASIFLTNDWHDASGNVLSGLIVRRDGESDEFFEQGTYGIQITRL